MTVFTAVTTGVANLLPRRGAAKAGVKMKIASLLLLCLCLPCEALVRMAIVIGNNAGLEEEKPLSYATRDAQQIYTALMQLGGVDQGRGNLLLDPTVDQVRLAFKDAAGRVGAFRAQGEKVQLLIYYSGHGSDLALHMNGEKLPLSDIRSYFRDLAADLKLLIADACFSGALIQKKGASLADPVPLKYVNELKVNGSAILTSSSAGEFSQESRELQGSLFTHYFLTAIRGAADFDHDGQVTLWEAYNLTQQNLRRKFAPSSGVSQHPEFDVDLHGSDNLVLTRVSLGQALLSLKGLPQGEYKIMEAVSSLEVAEVNLNDPEGLLLALPKATYMVYHSDSRKAQAGFADLRRAGRVDLGPQDFSPVALGALTAKGYADSPAMQRSRRGPLQLTAEPRLYTSFPGRGPNALALEAALQGNWLDLAASASFLYLPKSRGTEAGNSFEEGGLGAAGELRYYWSYSRIGAAFTGPRGEYWSLRQSVNGLDMRRGEMLGGFAVLGLERLLGAHFSLSATAEAGWFWSYDGRGNLVRSLTFPFSLSLKFGP
jgi:hypothetical protein